MAREANWGLWVLLCFFFVLFMTGGGSRNDLTSLLFLRPFSALVFGASVLLLPSGSLRRCRTVAFLLAALAFLHLLHLLPLPPGLFAALPGRSAIVEGLDVVELGDDWRPLSLVPFRTWNSLYALIVPAAALLLIAARQRSRSHRLVIFLLVGLAAFSALLGLLQAVAPHDAGLYLYRVTNRGLAVGLFANRNHNAVFLATAIPMIAYLIGTMRRHAPQWQRLALLALLAVLIPATLMTGSRAGAAALIVALATFPFLVGHDTLRSLAVHRRLLIAAAVGLFLLLALVAFMPTGTIMRSADLVVGEDIRFDIWPVSIQVVQQHFPFGAGMGAFVEAYQILEPDDQLRSQYVNHAHNDVLELLVDAGIAGAALLVAGTVLWVRTLVRALRAGSSARLPRLGLIVSGLLAAASIVDYPLRTPALAALFVIALVWCNTYTTDKEAR